MVPYIKDDRPIQPRRAEYYPQKQLLAAVHALVSIAFLTVILVAFCACAHYTVNRRLGEDKAANNVDRQSAQFPERSDDLCLVLAFSGGGTRASALSFGVLKGLSQTRLPALLSVPERADASTHRTLLDEVDIISSVSGGSFTSAYYSLRKDRFFDEYENRFLYRNNNLKLFLHLLSPVNWVRLASAYYGTGDLAEQYYDRLLFGGATFGDIQAQNAPLLFIQATDIVEGYPFGFTSHQFGLICSDWAGFPIARAVAASSAFPGPFEGIVLRNYAGTCEQPDVSRLTRILKESDKGSRTYRAAFHMCSYLDSQRKPFIHLLDGGLSDNLGLRGPLEFIDLQGGLQEFLRSMGLQNTRRIAFIVVNAIGSVPEKWNSIGKIPGLGTMLEATEYVTLRLYAYDTMELLRSYIRKWEAQIENSDPGSPIDFYVIEVGFNALADDERRVLSTVPTTLSLPKATVDRLSEAGRRILYKSEDFRRLVRDLGGEIPASDP